MAEIPFAYKFVIVFALTACHAILSDEGRQIKSMNKKEEGTVEKGFQTRAEEGSRSSINLHQSAAERKEDFHTTEPSDLAGKKEIFPPMSFGDSAAAYKDDFRPKTPGNSPGVGHKFAEEEEEVEQPLSESNFQRTAPGDTPGVGHDLSDKTRIYSNTHDHDH